MFRTQPSGRFIPNMSHEGFEFLNEKLLKTMKMHASVLCVNSKYVFLLVIDMDYS